MYRLQFVANTSQCISADVVSRGVYVRTCSGGNGLGTNWARVPVSGGIEWYSPSADDYLTSDNRLGDQLFLDHPSLCGSGGCYFKWGT